jgi:uncharacterized protein
LLKRIKVVPLAAESFGVRSMCTLVETADVRVLLDAGVSLAPYRFGLLPHPLEFQAIARLRKKIAEAAEKVEVVTVSHYHFDHHTPSYEDWLVNWTEDGETARQIYGGKTVLMKNPKTNINASQRHRAWMFQKTAGKYVKEMFVADGRAFRFGETEIRFSQGVAHGSEDFVLGWVVIATIECGGERFMHAPDVQGPMSRLATELILAGKPDVLMVGGPPFYLEGVKFDEKQIDRGMVNLKRIVQCVPVSILEHHSLRGVDWREKANPVFELARESGNRLVTAAEYLGEDNLFLESRRKDLFSENLPSDEFRKWMKLGVDMLARTKPPI